MDKLAEKIAELAEKFGPNVIDAARGAAQVNAYSGMMGALLFAICGAGLIYGGRFLWNMKCDDSIDDSFAHGFGVAGIVLGCLLVVIGAGIMLDPWTWTAINNPDLYIAKKVLKL